MDVQPANSTSSSSHPPTSEIPTQCHPSLRRIKPEEEPDHVFGGPTGCDLSFLCRYRQ